MASLCKSLIVLAVKLSVFQWYMPVISIIVLFLCDLKSIGEVMTYVW